MELVFLFVTCFLLRAIPRVLRPDMAAFDTCFHLYYAGIIHANRMSIPERYPRLYFNDPCDYPFFYHWLLALFSERLRARAEMFSSAIFDTGILLILYFFCSSLAAGDSALARLPLYASLAFCFHPALLKFGNGPRIHFGSPRVLGQFLYVAHLVTAWLAWNNTDAAMLILSIACVALLFVTAKFVVQVLVLFTPFIAVFGHPHYLFIPVAGFILAVIVTRGLAWRVVRSSLQHSAYYFSDLQQRFIWPYYSPYGAYIKNLIHNIRSLGKRKFSIINFINKERNPLNVLLFLYPESLFVIYFSVASGIFLFGKYMLIVLFAAIVCLILTELRIFMFLGDGERYMQFAAPFLSIAASYYLFVNNSFFLIIFCIYGAFVYLYGIYLFIKNEFINFSNDTNYFFASVNNLPPGNILSIGSYHSIALLKSFHTLVDGGVNLSKDIVNKNDFLLLYDNYPYPSGDLAKIIERFSVNYIITGKNSLERYTKNYICEDFLFHEKCKLVLESSYLQLYIVE